MYYCRCCGLINSTLTHRDTPLHTCFSAVKRILPFRCRWKRRAKVGWRGQSMLPTCICSIVYPTIECSLVRCGWDDHKQLPDLCSLRRCRMRASYIGSQKATELINSNSGDGIHLPFRGNRSVDITFLRWLSSNVSFFQRGSVPVSQPETSFERTKLSVVTAVNSMWPVTATIRFWLFRFFSTPPHTIRNERCAVIKRYCIERCSPSPGWDIFGIRGHTFNGHHSQRHFLRSIPFHGRSIRTTVYRIFWTEHEYQRIIFRYGNTRWDKTHRILTEWTISKTNCCSSKAIMIKLYHSNTEAMIDKHISRK